MNKEKIITIQKNKFNKPNVIINIINQKNLSLKSKKVYNLLIKKLMQKNDKEFVSQTINTSYSELARELNTTKHNDIKDILDELQGFKITFEHLLKNEPHKANSILMSEYLVEKKTQNGLIISFPIFLTKELLKHKKKYAKLDLIELNNLKFTYSITLYEMFMSSLCNHSKQLKNFTEIELRKRFGLNDKYKNINDFNKNVIKKSIEDINKNMNIHIELLKVDKPTKTNEVKERTYKFFIRSKADKNMGINQFKYFLDFCDETIVYQYGPHQYYFGLDIESNKRRWFRKKSSRKTTESMADNIWSELYKEFQVNVDNFFNKYNIEPYIVEDYLENIGKSN